MNLDRLTCFAGLGLALVALAAPTAAAQVDLRNPDTRDPAPNRPSEQQAFPGLADQVGGLDLRSPDRRDAAPKLTVVEVTETSDGMHWGDAAIGAGALLGLILVGCGSVMVLRHRRHDGPRRRRAATAG